MKRLGQWLSLLGLLSIGALATAQENYPSRVISIMVPYAAGAASDFTARTLNDLIARQVGGQAIVENLPGASGAIAANKVLAAPADGYYVFQGSPNELILASLVNKSTRYRSEDFQWVAPVAVSPLVVVVNGALPVRTLDELVDLAQSRKDKPLSYGTPGSGTLYNLLGELFTKRTGAPLTHVPYKSGATLVQDLMGGQFDFAFLPYQSFYADYQKQGRLRVVGALSAGKSLPTPFNAAQSAADSKMMKDFNFTIWTSYMVRKGTPKPIVERLNSAVAASLRDPHARAQLELQAKSIFEPMSVDAGEKFYTSEVDRYRELIKTVGYERQ